MGKAPDASVVGAGSSARLADPLYPLQAICADTGRTAPAASMLPGQALPEPQRTLLVHHRDMTPTLEQFHNERMGLRVLQSQMKGPWFWREIVLFGADSKKPAEYGVIRIFVDRFEAAPRAAILACKTPLGTILNQFAVPHRGRPKAYFKTSADLTIASALQCALQTELYGRCNVLENTAGEVLAETVEILPQ